MACLTSTKLYFSSNDSFGKMPIESFTGIKYFKIILHNRKRESISYALLG